MRRAVPSAGLLTGCCILLLLAVLGVGVAQELPPAPRQPIPYSHKVHVSQGLKCTSCHENKDPGESMGIPATAKCMTCHVAVKKDSPSIAKLAEFHNSKRQVPWERVYQIPSYVFFSHRAHIEAGGTCQGCHGPVQDRDIMRKEVDTSMGACMDCHRRNKASLDCTFCHEARN